MKYSYRVCLQPRKEDDYLCDRYIRIAHIVLPVDLAILLDSR